MKIWHGVAGAVALLVIFALCSMLVGSHLGSVRTTVAPVRAK